MKVLVADDDALIRRLLCALLTKLGHEVEAVEDGRAAVQALESENPPSLAIMDWVMPGMNGPEICKRIRARSNRSRPYLLLLSAKAEKNEIISGLDSGADDYLVKPFDPMALLARLRVAQRIIAYQQELQKNIGDMEILLQRHNLLGELFGKQGRGESNTSFRLRTRPAVAVPALAMLAPDRMNELLTHAVAEIGLGQAQAVTLLETQAAHQAIYTAWAPLVLPAEGLWVDLLLDLDETSAVAKFEALLGRIPVSERELLDFMAETFNLICTSVRDQLGDQAAGVLMPFISRSVRTLGVPARSLAGAQISHHALTLPGMTLTVRAVRQAAPIINKSLGQLRELDVLAANLPSPSTEEVFLLNQGVVLNPRYIDKLVSLAQGRAMRVAVLQPTSITQFFCLGHISEA